MSTNDDQTPLPKNKRGELVLLVASFSLLGVTMVWFFFWAKPDQRGQILEAGQPSTVKPLESAPSSTGNAAATTAMATQAEVQITSPTSLKSPHFEVGKNVRCATRTRRPPRRCVMRQVKPLPLLICGKVR